jgi:hypothetical protein
MSALVHKHPIATSLTLAAFVLAAVIAAAIFSYMSSWLPLL